ncbi:MAG: hypothetical protein AABM30_00135 [Actinomycetota bacterium]
MASDQVTPGLLDRASASSELGAEWRRLTRAATVIAIITSPAPFFWYHNAQGWGLAWSLVATFFTVIAFRGLVDLLTRRLLPWPSLYGTDDADLKEEDVVSRRRASREESLELALYTFKYWPNINSVVTLLPPDKTRRPAFLFRRRKLQSQLSTPLEATLPNHELVSTDAITESEAATVQQLTEGSIFLSSFSQTPNGHTLLLLGTGNQ